MHAPTSCPQGGGGGEGGGGRGGGHRHAAPRRATRSPSAPPARGHATHSPPVEIAHAQHLLVATEALVDAAWETIRSREQTFAAVAGMVSQCPSAAVGGDLGWFRRGVMAPPFDEAVFSSAAGAVVKVHSAYGWHLVQVRGREVVPGAMEAEELATLLAPPPTTTASSSSSSSPTTPVAGQPLPPTEGPQVVDVREATEVAQCPPLAGVTWLPMAGYADWQGPFEAGTLLDPARPVLVLCHRGVRAAKAADFFLQRGYKYARVVRGGVDRYARVVDPSVPLYTK